MPKLFAKPWISTRPEDELLLCSARSYVDPKTAERIQNLLQDDLDWIYLIGTAFQHRVLPLLYSSLKNTSLKGVPQVILSQLRNHFHANTQNNLFLTKELLILLELFADHNISAIPFKGPVLAASAYGELALRQFSDLDILVHKQDFLKAKDLLIRHGYHHLYCGEHETAYAQAQLLRDDGKVNIDLHYGITPKNFCFSLDPEPFWQRLQPISVDGTTVLNLSPEDALMVTYVQGTKEGWASLSRICDMAELIGAYPQINWGQIIDHVGSLRCKRRFFLALLLVSHHLKTPLPEEVFQRIKVPILKLLAAQMYQQLLCKAEVFEGTLSSLASMDKLHARIRVALTPSSTDRAWLPLPPFLYFLYYLLRPLRLVQKYRLGPAKIGRLLQTLV